MVAICSSTETQRATSSATARSSFSLRRVETDTNSSSTVLYSPLVGANYVEHLEELRSDESRLNLHSSVFDLG